MDTSKIALQLYTVRESAERDMAETLHKVAEIGYRAVELAGYGNVSAAEVGSVLAQNGLQAVSAHVGLDGFEAQPQQTIEELKTLGCSYAVVPWLAPARRKDRASVLQFASTLNRLGEVCQTAGLQLAYHNHAFEFEPLDGSNVWEILNGALDPALVKLEFDVYWGTYAGLDPVELIETYQGRLPLLHIKDLAETDGKRQDVPVGEGQIPWPQVLRAGQEAGTDWYIVELDNPRDAFDDIERGLHNLQNLVSQV